jgi:predicted RNA-binding protein with EMAP domain
LIVTAVPQAKVVQWNRHNQIEVTGSGDRLVQQLRQWPVQPDPLVEFELMDSLAQG